MKISSILLLMLIGFSVLPREAISAANQNWKILYTSWSETDERDYSSFVQALGESNCNTIASCIKSSANPYHSSDTLQLSLNGDCGKFAYLLRGYFAWKKSLPFTWATGVKSADGEGADLRYSPHGNLITSRTQLTQSSSAHTLNGPKLMKQILGDVFTAMFRFDASHDMDNGEYYDFYPTKIDRSGVRPGTIIYDPNGHVAVVYKVEVDGRIRYIDAHPDDSVTRGVYGQKFMRANPGMGAGFKNFRPITLVNATRSTDGSYIGGKIVATPYSEIPEYSLEQFYGTGASSGNWKKAAFKANGESLGYYDFVRTRMAVGELKYQPVEELVNGIQALCSDLKDRVTAVDTALQAKMNLREHPSNLPQNIYGTSGDWETYSSPSRDARIKTSFRELLTQAQMFVELYKQRSSRIEYSGNNLGEDLRTAYEREANKCNVEYSRSDSSKAILNFDEISSRLFLLSFDPYHCAELRWGESGDALRTCEENDREDASKRAWYKAEQRLRNQLDRAYNVTMGFSLQQLEDDAPNSGVNTPPDTNLKEYLNSL